MADKAFVLGEDTRTIYGFKMTESDDASSLVYDVGNKLSATFSGSMITGGGFNLGGGGSEFVGELSTEYVEQIAFSHDGTRFAYVDSNAVIHQYDVTVPWDLNSAWNHKQTDISSQLPSLGAYSTYGMAFSTDGFKMYVTADTRVFQFDLAEEADPSTAIFSNILFDAGNELTGDSLGRFESEDGDPVTIPLVESIQFKPDGTKMYISDFGGMRVVEYSLSTPFDVDTATPTGFVVDLYSLTEILQAVEDFTIGSNGTKAVMVASSMVAIFDLLTPWDLSTLTLSQTTELYNANVESGDLNQSAIFSTDGMNFYISGYSKVVNYRLSAPFAVETGASVVYDDVSFYVGDEELTPHGMSFNTDGTKMFVVGGTKSVYQYSLNVPFDVSSASSQSFYVGGNSRYASFSPDGTKMFVLGISSDSVHQYSLSTAFDVSSAVYDDISFYVGNEETTPMSVSFNADGTKMFIVGGTWDTKSVHQYSLSTAFDVSSAVYDDVSFYVGSEAIKPYAMSFNTDGTKMFVLGSSDSVHQYSLSNAFDVSSAAYDDVSFYVGDEDTTPYAMSFNTDGTKMFVLGISSKSVHQYSLSNAFDVSSAVYDDVSFYVGINPYAMSFNTDGTKMFVLGNNTVYQFSLNAAFDVSSASLHSFYVGDEETNPYSVSFSPDGTKMFVLGISSKSVHQYSLSTAFDVSSAVYDDVSFYVGDEDTNPYDVSFSPDGTKMFLLGRSDSVYQYSLSVPFDVSSAVYDDVSFYVGNEETNPYSVSFNTDGTKMFVLGNNSVHQYSLSTAFDVSSAVYDDVSFYVGSEAINPYAMSFNTDGTKMFVLGSFSKSVHQYSLPPSGTTVNIEEGQPKTFDFSEDGKNLYVYGTENNYVYHAKLEIPFDLRTAVFEQEGYQTEDELVDMIFKKASGANSLFFLTKDKKVIRGTLSGSGLPVNITSDEFSIGSEVSSPESIEMNDDGTRFYIQDSDGVLHEYEMTVAFGVSTGSYTGETYEFGVNEFLPNATSINYDKSSETPYMYVLDDGSETVNQFKFGDSVPDKYTASLEQFELTVPPTFGAAIESLPELSVSFDMTGRSLVCDHELTTVTDISDTSMTYTENTDRIPVTGDIFKFYNEEDNAVVVASTDVADNGNSSYTVTYDKLPFTPDINYMYPKMIRRIDGLAPTSFTLEGSDVVVMNYDKVAKRGRELAFKQVARAEDVVIVMTRFDLEKEEIEEDE